MGDLLNLIYQNPYANLEIDIPYLRHFRPSLELRHRD